ncbi:hypothetical protein ACLIA0_06335 [Bacillaceae bacterium W0354]
MLNLERDGYTKQEVMDVLHGKYGPRHIRFRYDLLDSEGKFKKHLHIVTGGEVKMSALAQIKRTARFSLKDDPDINWLSDRIQPFTEIRMTDNNYIEFPLGVFLLSSPQRKDQNSNVYREVEAYDGTIILKDDKLDSRYTVIAGENYIDAVVEILLSAGITKYNIDQTDKTLPTDVDWPPGTEKIEIVNDLLSAINYTPIQVDGYGFFTSRLYRSPSRRTAEYTYKVGEESVIFDGMTEELDIFNVPNKWVVVLADPEREPLKAVYTNDNPDSPTSTVNRGRIIVDYREVDNIADQESLNEYVQRIAFNASQIYGKLEFETAIMPMHEYNDVLQIEYSPLSIIGKYVETGWTIPLQAGGKMRHSVRKVVDI